MDSSAVDTGGTYTHSPSTHSLAVLVSFRNRQRVPRIPESRTGAFPAAQLTQGTSWGARSLVEHSGEAGGWGVGWSHIARGAAGKRLKSGRNSEPPDLPTPTMSLARPASPSLLPAAPSTP